MLDLSARCARCLSVMAKKPALDLPLVKTFHLEAHEVEEIKFAALTYLWHSASSAGCRLSIPTSDEWFLENAKVINSLPNVTPNGLILPKRETIVSYNFVHMITAKVTQRYFNERKIAAIHSPINIRLVDGTPNPSIDSRPRSSVKLHSDIWAAEPSNSMAVFLPIIGDIASTSVEFSEPEDLSADLQRPLEDFAVGSEAARIARIYPFAFVKNHMVTMDSFCLHRTIKLGARFRLSIDFRILYSDRLPSDLYIDSPRLSNYVLPAMFYSIGKSYMVVSRKSMREQVQDVTANAYAARYDISGL